MGDMTEQTKCVVPVEVQTLWDFGVVWMITVLLRLVTFLLDLKDDGLLYSTSSCFDY